MITIIVSGIVGFWLGFFCCALLRVDGHAPRPRPGAVDDAVYQHMEVKDE